MRSVNRLHPWLLVFDLDGTLIDSSLDLCLAVNAALAHVDLPELPQLMISGFIGDGAAVLIERAVAASTNFLTQNRTLRQQAHVSSLDQETLAFFLLYYREHKLDNTRLYDGVLASLRAMRLVCPGLLMAVLTNKPVRPSREICAALGLDSYLFVNYGGDSFQTKKPDPEGLETIIREASERYGADLNRFGEERRQGVVMIGDSEVDVFTARRAGVRSLGCRYGLAPEALERSSPDLICDSPLEWLRLLEFST